MVHSLLRDVIAPKDSDITETLLCEQSTTSSMIESCCNITRAFGQSGSQPAYPQQQSWPLPSLQPEQPACPQELLPQQSLSPQQRPKPVQSHFESHAMSNTSDTQALLVQIMSMLAILHTIKELTNQSTSHASSSDTITANILTAIVHISDQIANAHVHSNAQTDISEDCSPAGDCALGEASHHDAAACRVSDAP